ncbi:MAG: TolC family protein [Aureliella sp.]
MSACALLIACSGCMAGPNYQSPIPQLPSDWQSTPKSGHALEIENIVQTVNLGRGVVAHDYAYSLSSTQCPWWEVFLDEDLRCLIGMQRARSPRLHELRAAIDQAWHNRWNSKLGFFPEITGATGYESFLSNSEPAGTRLHSNLLSASVDWELDLFGGRQREVEAADRNVEAQVETYRNGMVFLASEIGLFYTDYRVAEARIQLQLDNIELYEQVVRVTREKLEFGGVAQVDLDEAEARLSREVAALPNLEGIRDEAKIELARVVGVYSEELDPLLTPNQAIPSPGRQIIVPSPSDVLPLRPDIRRQERQIGRQVALVAKEVADLYPTLNFSYTWNGGDLALPILNPSTLGFLIQNARRLVDFERERASIKAAEAQLQRELHNYQLGLVTASSEIENAIVDLQIAGKRLASLELALAKNKQAFDRVYDAYLSSLVDVRDIIRIQGDLLATQTEYIFAQNLLAKGTVRLYKAVGGIDVPAIPARMLESPYQVADASQGNPFLSRVLSLGRDTQETLQTNRVKARIGRQPWYHVGEDGVLRNGVPNENPFLNRMWNLPAR